MHSSMCAVSNGASFMKNNYWGYDPVYLHTPVFQKTSINFVSRKLYVSQQD